MSGAQASLKEQQEKAAALQEEIDSARSESANQLTEVVSKKTELANLQEAKARIDEQFSAQSALVDELRQQTSKASADLADVQSKVRNSPSYI